MDKLASDLSNLIDRFKPSHMAEEEQLAKVAGLLEALGLRSAAPAAAPSGAGIGALAPIAALLALAGGAYAFRDKLGLGGGEMEADGKIRGEKGKNPRVIKGGMKGSFWDAIQRGKTPDRPQPKQEPKKPSHFEPILPRAERPTPYPKIHKAYTHDQIRPNTEPGPKGDVMAQLEEWARGLGLL